LVIRYFVGEEDEASDKGFVPFCTFFVRLVLVT